MEKEENKKKCRLLIVIGIIIIAVLLLLGTYYILNDNKANNENKVNEESNEKKENNNNEELNEKTENNNKEYYEIDYPIIELSLKEKNQIELMLDKYYWAFDRVNGKNLFLELTEQARLDFICSYYKDDDKNIIDEEIFFKGNGEIQGTGGFLAKTSYIKPLYKTMFGKELDIDKLDTDYPYATTEIPAGYVVCSMYTGGISSSKKVHSLHYNEEKNEYILVIDIFYDSEEVTNVLQLTYKNNNKDYTFNNTQFISFNRFEK